MDAALQDKVVLITGAARRIGASIASRLHAAGARVIVHHHRSAEDAAALVAELNRTREGSALSLQADLLDIDALPALIERALQASGRLDVLINNASSFFPTPVGTITAAQWDDLLGTNLRAPLFLSQAAAPALKAAQGCIINITDIHGVQPLRHHPVYSAAKAGLIMLTKSLARELAPEVRVNAIAPGPVMFPAQGLTAEVEAEIIERTLLKRRGSPDDIAAAALYFAAHAPYVTGQMLNIDGGRSVRS
jgi:pteridine reductase